MTPVIPMSWDITESKQASKRANDRTPLICGYGMFLRADPALSGLISQWFRSFRLSVPSRYPDQPGPGRRVTAWRDLGPALGPCHLRQRQGFQLGDEPA